MQTFDGRHLPLIDNTVNLLVAGALGGIPLAEVMRVFTPAGVALNGQSGAVLLAVSVETGEKLSETALDAPPCV